MMYHIGYGKEDNDNEKVGIYVHTTDDGFIRLVISF